MNIFKQAYKIKRSTSNEIYKGFGFKHLSDATQYYVHPNNQSFKGTTTLCQSIGEAVSLYGLLLLHMIQGEDKLQGDVLIHESKNSMRICINIKEDYREAGVIEDNVYSYLVHYDMDNTIKIGAYNNNGKFIRTLGEEYLLLPAFTILLANEMQENEEMAKLFLEYIEKPAVDLFVNIHEDFYQNHKFEEHNIIYEDISTDSLEDYTSHKESYKVIGENKNALKEDITITINRFSQNDFDIESQKLIPKLGPEFNLPKELQGVSNAIQSGDVLAILFHGPAGTGKTMNCKLISKEIQMPIMDTINCTENLDEFILGKYIPVNNEIVFLESNVTKAIRNGGAVVFEEINFAKPQYLAFLNSLLDDNGFVRLDNGEIVKRHKNFRFLATMNFGYFGTKELNQALYNRFNSIVEVASLSDEAIKRMLTYRTPECMDFVDNMISVYHKIKKKIESEELDVVISPRNLENWARMAKYEGYIKSAEKTLIPIAKCDRVLEETIRSIIILYRW